MLSNKIFLFITSKKEKHRGYTDGNRVNLIQLDCTLNDNFNFRKKIIIIMMGKYLKDFIS